MNRLVLYTVAVMLGAVIAVFYLVSSLTAHAGVLVFVAVFGLWAGALALMALAFVEVMRDRRRILGSATDPDAVIAGAARGLRIGTVLAIGFSVLMFADCSSSSVSGNSALFGSAMAEPGRFWSLAAWLALPMLVALTLPTVLLTASELSRSASPRRARALATVALWSTAAIAVAAVVMVPASLLFGFSECLTGTSPGACAAGGGGFMDALSVGALALFLPYLFMVRQALKAPKPT
jgi:hypothetical protein